MKYLVVLLSLFASLAFANGIKVVVEDTSAAGAVSATTPLVLNGYVDAIVVDVAADTTQTVAVATSDETIFTGSVTADGVYRPRAALVGSTNAALSGVFDRFYLVQDALTVTVTASSVPTNDVNVYIKIAP